MIRVIIKRGPHVVVDTEVETTEEATALERQHTKPPCPVRPGEVKGPDHYAAEVEVGEEEHV